MYAVYPKPWNHLLRGSGSTVLTATSFVYENPDFRPLTESTPLTDRKEIWHRWITLATATPIPNLVQIRLRGA